MFTLSKFREIWNMLCLIYWLNKRYVWVFMKLLTKNDWQRSRTVALFQSCAIMLPTNGTRWILWVILPTGMMLAIRASPRCARETLYRWLFASGLGWKGVNHLTYAKCLGGWLLVGNKSLLAMGLMLNMARTCATRWADVITMVGKNRRLHYSVSLPRTPVSPSFPLWTSTVSNWPWMDVSDGLRQASMHAGWTCIMLAIDSRSPLSLACRNLIRWYVEMEVKGRWTPCTS